MKPHPMTESERALTAAALREKAELDGMHARRFRTPESRELHEQFQRQAALAGILADLIEAADLVDVWPADTADSPKPKKSASGLNSCISARRAKARKLLAIYHETSGLISYLGRATAAFAPDQVDPDFEDEARASWYAFEAMDEASQPTLERMAERKRTP